MVTGRSLWILFVACLLVSALAMFNHELWGDEFHSWNIAKASGTVAELFQNIRYEGHPPLWYLILWISSKFTHNPAAMQLVHWLISAGVIYCVIFLSHFTFWIKTLLPFGYFFVFEYGILSRNYALGILLALLLCRIITTRLNQKWLLYYIFLFLLTNTHLLGVLLAASIHFYVLLSNRKLFVHVLAGLVICIPALYFIFPPADSGLNLSFWTNQWSRDHLGLLAKTPLRVFMPIPALNKQEIWNTQILIDASRFIGLIVSAALLFMAIYILKNDRKAMAVFVINLLFTAIIGAIFPLTTMRYAGFIYIGFIVALWLLYEKQKLELLQQQLLAFLLIFQVIGGIAIITRDLREPFSHADKVHELVRLVPGDKKLVSDYWAVNALSAFTDKKYYAVGLDKNVSFLLWNQDLKVSLDQPYTKSFRKLVTGNDTIYMISMYHPRQIESVDSTVMNEFEVKPVKAFTGAIEKWSNLYLYRVNNRYR
jgi:hypothetical protein